MSGNKMSNDGKPNKTSTTFQTAVLMAGMTLLSKLIGFVRETVLASMYGTSYVMDAYGIAQKIPSIVMGGLLGAIGTAYMPVFSEIVENRGKDAGNDFTSQTISISLLISFVVFVFGVAFSDQLVFVFANGFVGEAASLTAFYLKFAFFNVILYSSLGILDLYLQYNNVFLLQIGAGCLFNFGIIAVAVFCAFTSHYYLAAGLSLGYALHLGMEILGAKKVGLHFRPQIMRMDSARRLSRMVIPAFLGTAITQINTFVDSSLATKLQEGSVAALNYGHLLVMLITGVTTSIVVTLLYPKITKAASSGNWKEFNTLTEKSVSVILMLGIPFMLGAIAFSDEVVQVVYERGAFDEGSTVLTADAFLYYSACIVFLPFSALLSNVFFSLQDTKATTISSAISILINIVLDFLFISTMEHKGLALATSVAAAANCAAQLIILNRCYTGINILPRWTKILRIFFAAVVSVLLGLIAYHVLMRSIRMPRMVFLLTAILLAVACYLAVLKIMRIEEADLLNQIFK